MAAKTPARKPAAARKTTAKAPAKKTAARKAAPAAQKAAKAAPKAAPARKVAPKALPPQPKPKAPAAAPAAPAAGTEKAPRAPRIRAAHREAMERADKGFLPAAPDFSADTHTRFRPKLEKLVALAKAGDVAGLEAFPINPISTSPKAMARFRDLAVRALRAKAAKGAAAK